MDETTKFSHVITALFLQNFEMAMT